MNYCTSELKVLKVLQYIYDSPLLTAKEKIKLFTPKFYDNNNTDLSEIACVRRAWLARSSLAASSRVARAAFALIACRGRDVLVRSPVDMLLVLMSMTVVCTKTL